MPILYEDGGGRERLEAGGILLLETDTNLGRPIVGALLWQQAAVHVAGLSGEAVTTGLVDGDGFTTAHAVAEAVH